MFGLGLYAKAGIAAGALALVVSGYLYWRGEVRDEVRKELVLDHVATQEENRREKDNSDATINVLDGSADLVRHGCQWVPAADRDSCLEAASVLPGD